METVNITDSEWEVMRVVWTLGHATSKDITEILTVAKDWKPATVKTLLGRLVKKQALSTETVGKRFVYRAVVTEDASLQTASQDMMEHICAMKVGQMITEMIVHANLTRDDLTKIQSELARKKPIEHLYCNCIPAECTCSQN
jgi:CopY/TcrY family copper transport repressor